MLASKRSTKRTFPVPFGPTTMLSLRDFVETVVQALAFFSFPNSAIVARPTYRGPGVISTSKYVKKFRSLTLRMDPCLYVPTSCKRSSAVAFVIFEMNGVLLRFAAGERRSNNALTRLERQYASLHSNPLLGRREGAWTMPANGPCDINKQGRATRK